MSVLHIVYSEEVYLFYFKYIYLGFNEYIRLRLLCDTESILFYLKATVRVKYVSAETWKKSGDESV